MKKYITSIAVVFFAVAGISSANLVSNGHFETGDLTGWNWTPTSYSDPAMTASVVTFDTVFGRSSLCFRVNPGTDSQHIGREEGGWLSQSLNLQAGTEYDVEISGTAIRDLGGAANADGGRIRLYMNSDLLWDWDINYIVAGTTVRNLYSGTYTPSATGIYDLSVLFARTYMNNLPVIYHYLDNISVVPEPATIVLFGLGGLVLRRRKRV